MNTKRLMEALVIVAAHKPEGEDIAVGHDELFLCGKLPFTKYERAKLRQLGFMWDASQECWSCFV